MGSTLDNLVTAAARRTGCGSTAMGLPVVMIVDHHRSGWSTEQVICHVTVLLGPGNKAITPEFVSWVISQL